VHQDINPDLFFKNTYLRAQAAEALASAKIEIAQRGLAVTVTKNYYVLVTSQRKYATAQQSLDQAQRFLQIRVCEFRRGTHKLRVRRGYVLIVG